MIKQKWINSRIIIWTSCAAYLLVVTVLMAYAYRLYEIYGATIVFFLAIAALQPFKIAYEWYALHLPVPLQAAAMSDHNSLLPPLPLTVSRYYK